MVGTSNVGPTQKKTKPKGRKGHNALKQRAENPMDKLSL